MALFIGSLPHFLLPAREGGGNLSDDVRAGERASFEKNFLTICAKSPVFTGKMRLIPMCLSNGELAISLLFGGRLPGCST